MTLVIQGVRGDYFGERADWVGRLVGRLRATRAKVLFAQV